MAGWESVDGTTILNEDDLRDVRLAVADLAARWKDLGISLGIRLSDLDAIFSTNPHSASDCLRETLAIWLRQSYNVEEFEKPTWRRLVKAVEDRVGGNNCALAQKIARAHPGAPDKKHRKLESQEHSKLQKLDDSAGIFCLPQYIRVMVSNYQPLQTIFAIPKGERPTQQIKADERFSPTVTVVDTATQQPLDCVLLLHGEKPPEVNYKTLFCYITVQVSYRDALGSHPYPLNHVESKPCKQGKLPLTFCFHQPGTVCNIQLSIHSIVDSEGVEYMYNSEDCDCNVQIIDRDQHGGVKMRDRHGVVRMKEPPPLRYTGPLTTKRFHKLEKEFIKLFLSPDYEQIHQLTEQLVVESSISVDIKVFALCWKALSVSVHENYEHAEELLRTAWEKASPLECENGLLLQGRVLKHLSHMQYSQGNDNKAGDYLLWAKNRLLLAAPSNETAFALYTESVMKRRRLFRPNCTFSSQLYKSTEKHYELLLQHAKHMEEYEKPFVCSFLTMKASFHLRSDMITDELPPEEYWPSPDDLRKAEECLNSVSLDTMPSQSTFYTAKYYCTVCDLYIWKENYSEAMCYLEKAKRMYDQMNVKRNIALRRADQRLKLLERLKGDEKIDEILKTYSNTDNM